MDIVAKVQFKCPKCSTPGEIDIPRGELMTSVSYHMAVWPVTHTICAGCVTDLSLVLVNIALQGQQWGVRETPKMPSKIITVPSLPGGFPPTGNN